MKEECPHCGSDCDCVIDCHRHRVKYRGENCYILVGLKDGKPSEVRISTSDPNKIEQQLTLAGLDYIAQMITTQMEYEIPLDVILYDMRLSSRSGSDLPGVLHGVLNSYLEEPDE